MDLSQFRSMSPEQQAQKFAEFQTLLHALEGAREEAQDENVVWIQNRHGVRDVMKFGLWRRYYVKHPEAGVRLLRPDEVVEEEQKANQAFAERAEKTRLWKMLPFRKREEMGSHDGLTVEDLRELVVTAPKIDQLEAMAARIRELEAQVEQQPARRGPGRPRKELVGAGAEADADL